MNTPQTRSETPSATETPAPLSWPLPGRRLARFPHQH